MNGTSKNKNSFFGRVRSKLGSIAKAVDNNELFSSNKPIITCNMVDTQTIDARGIYKVECYVGQSIIEIERSIIIHINKIINADPESIGSSKILKKIYAKELEKRATAPNKIREPFFLLLYHYANNYNFDSNIYNWVEKTFNIIEFKSKFTENYERDTLIPPTTELSIKNDIIVLLLTKFEKEQTITDRILISIYDTYNSIFIKSGGFKKHYKRYTTNKKSYNKSKRIIRSKSKRIIRNKSKRIIRNKSKRRFRNKSNCRPTRRFRKI